MLAEHQTQLERSPQKLVLGLARYLEFPGIPVSGKIQIAVF
jgi:hypothetical protein